MKKRSIYLLSCLFMTIACTTQPNYQNSNLPAETRADDLIKHLTLEEKVGLMMDNSASVERLGIKPYNWWNEALHGIARAGLGTVFPQPIGMAATFDEEALHRVFVAVSDEARAKNTRSSAEGSYNRYQGLTMWTPNVNIYRDPRWGRGIETYGEDPYLTSTLGLSVVKGLQCLDSGEKYDKLHACAKHFAVHSGPEWNRHEYNAENISPRDLYETYLPAFEVLVKEGKVKEVMCAYNRFEGKPCCGSDQLLVHILREEWGYEGIVVSDCWAIADFYRENAHGTHTDAASASADAVLTGTDLECGSSYEALVESVKKGLISEEAINVAAKRLLKARFELGEMDPPSEVSWSKIPYSVVCSESNDSLALDMARKSITLLLNENNILPLSSSIKTVAVMGPNANDSVMQWGNYNGTPKRTITLLEGIQNAVSKNTKIIYEPACSWVDRTVIKSVFNECKTANGKGFTARYWDNKMYEGEPITTVQLTTPFRLCTSGATVFAPGVPLTNFVASYEATFTPTESGEVLFNFYSCGSGQLYIDGQEVKSYENNHGGKEEIYSLQAKANQSYQIEIKFQQKDGDAQLNFDLGFKGNVNIGKTVDSVKEADVIIFAGGISPSLEGEEMGVDLPGFRGGDRTDIELPAVQRELVAALHKAGKKVIFVNFSGSPIGFEPELKTCQAILQAWYPGQSGGTAVADVLFGKYNPSGKLPVTFYKNTKQLPDFEDYNMAGRTYRYMKEEPLFPFGYGLSYTTFTYDIPQLNKTVIQRGEGLTIQVPIVNNGTQKGDEIIQVYLRKQGDSEGPLQTLRAFKRIHLAAGEKQSVKLELTAKQLEWWNEDTNTICATPGIYDVMIGGSSKIGELHTQTLTIQ
ncbi:MAG: xylan 1,4-beta-xylosidase [Phocaeicola sp.]